MKPYVDSFLSCALLSSGFGMKEAEVQSKMSLEFCRYRGVTIAVVKLYPLCAYVAQGYIKIWFPPQIRS